eukprot:gene354-biopygen6443
MRMQRTPAAGVRQRSGNSAADAIPPALEVVSLLERQCLGASARDAVREAVAWAIGGHPDGGPGTRDARPRPEMERWREDGLTGAGRGHSPNGRPPWTEGLR